MQKIKGLDGLRGISVLMVILSHAMVFDRLGWNNPVFRKLVAADNGVAIFFVLSGFLITLLLLREKDQSGSISFLNFYARRTLRIFPLYLLVLTLVVLLDALSVTSVRGCTLLYAYTYLFNFVPHACYYNAFGHLWSLAVEEHFYLLWPFIFVLGRRVAIPLLVVFVVAAHFWGAGVWSAYAPKYFVDRWTFPAAAPIAYGCLAAYVASYLAASPRFSSWPRHAWLSGLPLLVGAVLIAGAVGGGPRACFFLGVALIVLYAYFNQASWLVRVLQFRPLAYIGLISYGLYIWQGILTGNGPHRMPASPDFPPPMDLGLLLTAIAAPLSYAFFEKPIMRLKRRFRHSTAGGGSEQRAFEIGDDALRAKLR